VQGGASWRAAGEDKPTERRQLELETIDDLLQPFDIGVRESGFGDALGDAVSRVGKLGPEREEIALEPSQLVIQVALGK
jgi:hypothetical protein